MKVINKISLKMRITLLAGVILLLCSVILTIGASYNAHSQLSELALTAVPGTVVSVQAIIPSDQILMPASGIGAIPHYTTAPKLTKAKRQFDTVNIIILVIVSALGMLLVYIIAGRSLRPIHELSKTVSAITEDNLQQRIPDENRTDEVGALGRSFNTMLDRLENSFLRQKRFSANVAHELKTPLSTISAGIQVLHLEDAPSVSDYEEALTTIEQNVNRLMAVVDDLLCLCNEQAELCIDAIDLEDMFKSICNELQPILREKKLETSVHCEIQTISGSKVLLYRACFNLVENAAKYNQEGGRILIETRTEEGIGKIIISDTGKGIPEDELQQIFEPFYRVNKSRSRKTGGAGLGLSIVKAVVERHGWVISASSVLGQGSAFVIMLAG